MITCNVKPIFGLIVACAVAIVLSSCGGDAQAQPALAVPATSTPRPPTPIPPTATPDPTPTPVPATATPEPTPTPASGPVNQALILRDLTPGIYTYPQFGAVESAFEVNMLYTIVELQNALGRASEAGATLREEPAFEQLVAEGRIHPNLAADMRDDELALIEVSDESVLVSFWFEYTDTHIDLHVCSHVAGTSDGEQLRVTSDRAFRFDADLRYVGLSTTPIDVEAFVPCPGHPAS